jgi:hypothetical protein
MGFCKHSREKCGEFIHKLRSCEGCSDSFLDCEHSVPLKLCHGYLMIGHGLND